MTFISEGLDQLRIIKFHSTNLWIGVGEQWAQEQT